MRKFTSILVTTTNSFDNANIEKYYDLISTNVVIGTNFFSDFSASFTDLFGGMSNTYQNKLQKIYDNAIFNLKEQASNLDANAIIGLKIDFDEVSGKGKSMFMVSAVGTPVKLKLKNDNIIEDEKVPVSIISNQKLINEIKRLTIISNLRSGVELSKQDWEFMFENPIVEIAEELINIYIGFAHNFVSQLLSDNLPSYLKLIDENIVIDILYKKMKEEIKNPTSKYTALYLIKINNLFDTNKVIELIKNDNISNAIECLSIDRDYYTKDNLKTMYEIVRLLNDLTDKGKIEMSKVFLGKDKEKYICPNGHTNDINHKFCSCCDLNIKGLYKSEVEKIQMFAFKVHALDNLF